MYVVNYKDPADGSVAGFTLWGKNSIDALRRLSVARKEGTLAGRVVYDSHYSLPSFISGAVVGAGLASSVALILWVVL